MRNRKSRDILYNVWHIGCTVTYNLTRKDRDNTNSTKNWEWLQVSALVSKYTE